MSLINETNNHKIYKVKHIHSSKENDYDTYIFIGGFYDEKIYSILEKLEKNDYSYLTSEENKLLGNVISNFRGKIGKLVPNKTHFIKDLINDDDTINIIRMKISHYIGCGIYQEHLWIQNQNIEYVDLVKFTNHLLSKNPDILLLNLTKNLQIILDLDSEEDIEKLVKEKLFVEKYKNKSKESISLFTKKSYNVNDLINDEEFIALLNTRYTILGREYQKTIKLNGNNIDYYQYIVANPFSDNVYLSDKIIMNQESNQFSKTLSYYGLINNNIINLVTHNDFIDNYNGNNLGYTVSLYWDSQSGDYTPQKLKQESESIKNVINDLSKTSSNIIKISKNIDNYKDLLEINDNYLMNDLVISINDSDYMFNFDIEKIFNIFETNLDVPFVKFVINDNTQNFKIFKPFIKKNLVKLKIFGNWKSNQIVNDIKYPINKKYLVFKLMFNNEKNTNIERYISLNLYENGYIIITFNKEFIKITELKEKMEHISNFLLKLKKINDDKIINVPETNILFKSGFHTGILRSKILHINFKTHINLKYDISLSEINDRINKMYPFFYGYIKNNIMKVIYKKVDDFDSITSIQNFVYKIFEKNKRLFEGQKSKYLDLLESIFLIDRQQSKKILDNFNPQNMPEIVKYHFLYGVDISIMKEKNLFNIQIENIHNINQLNNINELLLVLFNKTFDIKNLHTINNDDFTIEIEDKPLYIEEKIEENVDLGFTFDELGFDGELELENEEEFNKEIEKGKEKEKDKEKEDHIVIDYDIKKKGSDVNKIKFTNYMTQMREKADPGLYKVEDIGAKDESWKYSKTCDAAQMRQPYIIPKSKLDKIKDKTAITGYVKYRDHYYICPRIWDYKAEMPISVDEFVKNGLKSPYTQGEAIPAEKRNKEYLGDKYTVIIRKPTSGTYWAKTKVEKDWPAILKNTGSEAFPGFMKPKNHPKNLCVPCCFLKEPDDYQVNAPEIQKFTKAVGSDVCSIESESEIPSHSQETKEFDDTIICKNENYIKTDNAILDNCRYGQLPENLNILLRNHQEILISSSNNALNKYASCFLRRGVFSDKNSFLRSIASIKESISNSQVTFKGLINLITENITPEIFITLNEGTLINIFKFKYNLPRNRNQMFYFIEFINKYPNFVKWMGLENLKLDNINDLIKIYQNIENISDEKKRQENIIKLRKIRKLFIIFSSFYNFIKYCQDEKITKRHEFFLDLISRPLEWLFPDGINILMFSKETNNIFCNPYITDLSKPVIILLYDKNGKFEPVFLIHNKSSFQPVGVIKLNNEVNISSNNLIFLKNHLKSQAINVNLLKDTQKRLPVLKELVKVHLSNCSELPDSKYDGYKILPTASVIYNKLKKLSTIGYPQLEPKCQITSPLNNTEFIITVKGFVFPTRPSGIILDLPIYDYLEYFELIEDSSITPKKMLQMYSILNQNTNKKYGYIVSGLMVTEQNPKWVIGLLLDNNGLIPINPTMIDEFIDIIDKENDIDGKKLSIIVKDIYYETDYNISDNQYMIDDRIGYITEYQKFEYLYQHFKYELSLLLGSSKNGSYLKQINDILKLQTNDYYDMFNQLNDIINKIANKILKIQYDKDQVKDKIHNDDKTQRNNKKYFLSSCDKLTFKKCSQHPYCKQIGKNECGLNLETSYWKDLFINRLCESIIKNTNDRKQILNGEYKPSFYFNEGIKLTPNEILLTNENFYLIRQIYKSSKYHQEIGLFEGEQNQENVIKAKYEEIIENVNDIGDFSKEKSKSDSISDGIELTDLSGMKKKLKNVYATVFDKDGKYRSQYQAGPCIFPYVYGNNKQLYFDCNKDKDEGQRCPVEVDKFRRALKWGFCPADPRETRRRNKVEDINAKATNMKGRIDKGFKSGKCIFPFRYHPSYDLSWECITTKQKNDQKWCATSIKSGKNIAAELPIAADKSDKIYQKKWDYSSMYDSKGDFNDEFLRYNTRGYCPEKDENKKGKEKYNPDDQLTIDNFISNKCIQTDSKGGYSKKQLKQFAINQLGLKEEDIEGKKKEVICAMISEILSNMKSRTDLNGKNLLDIYKKDPALCDKGESGGGWYLGHLRKMASRYFGMDPNIAKQASKGDLCDFIVPILEKEQKRIEKNRPIQKVLLSEIYNKNPIYCEEGPSKGGFSLKELKEMGVKYFGISEDMNNKEEICQIIRNKLKEEKDNMNIEDKNIQDLSFDSDEYEDDENEYKTFKLLGELEMFKEMKKKSKKRQLVSRNSNTLTKKK